MKQERTGRARAGAALLAVVLLFGAACSAEGGGDDAATESATTATGGKRVDESNESVGSAEGAGYTPTDPLIADTGFRPDKGGFGFENYGELPAEGLSNLTPAEVRRIFGDGVCRDAGSGPCDLTPSAEKWMESANDGMAGGHCYGMAMTSQIMFKGKAQPAQFGADSTPALPIQGNPALARELAYAFVLQGLPAVKKSEIHGSPAQILDKLVETMRPDNPEMYGLGIYQRDMTGGHEVTPYAVEDHGEGRYSVLIYDNNFPGVTRQMKIDKDKNTWEYRAATNPSEPSALYEGDAETRTLTLDPVSMGLTTQPCPFCGDQPDAGGGGDKNAASRASAPGVQIDDSGLDLIYLDGSDEDHGHLLISDGEGHEVGYKDGKPVNTMPGAIVHRLRSTKTWASAPEPDYYVPTGKTYTITLDGSGMETADETSIGIISDSFEMAADDIKLDPGQKDTLVVGPDATTLSYTSSRGESPVLEIGFSDDDADLTFRIAGASYAANSTMRLALPLDDSGLQIDADEKSGESTFDIEMEYVDDNGELNFRHADTELSPKDSAVLKYADWDNDGEGIPFVIKRADGTEETTTLADGG